MCGKKGGYVCGAILLFLGIILYVFAAGSGEWFIKSNARSILKRATMPSFDAMEKSAAKCAAYVKNDDGIFVEADFKSADRKLEFEECKAGAKTHYYLYHVTNAADVMTGAAAAPVVEKRGPWVFTTETRSYTMTHHKSRDTVERTDRSFKLIDDAATKKLCPKCATDRLCASWPKATRTKTPTQCVYGKIAHDDGNKAYNTITAINNGYLGLLNALDVMPPIGMVDETAIQSMFGSTVANLIAGPASSLGGVTSGLSKLALAEMQTFVMTVTGVVDGAFANNLLPGNFETLFRSSSAYLSASMFSSVRATANANPPTSAKQGNFDLLKLDVNANTTYLSAGAYAKLFPAAGSDGIIAGHDISLKSATGIGFWMAEAVGAGALTGTMNKGVCNMTAGAGDGNSALLAHVGGASKEVRCAITKKVFALYSTITDGTSYSAGNVMPNQWAKNSVVGKGYYNATEDEAECPTGSSILPYLQMVNTAYPEIELSCFLKKANTDAAIGVPAKAIGRTLTAANIRSWGQAKTTRLFRFVTGARQSDGGKPDSKANPFNDDDYTTIGNSWNILSMAWKNVKPLVAPLAAKGVPKNVILNVGNLTQTFQGAGMSNAVAAGTAAAVMAGVPTTYAGMTLDQICNGAVLTVAGVVNQTKTKTTFYLNPMTCDEIQTLNAWTYYVADKFFYQPNVIDPTCSKAQLDVNDLCTSKCKAYKDCKPTLTTNDFGASPKNVLNCTAGGSPECAAFKKCYFPAKNTSRTNPFADRIKKADNNGYVGRGGQYVTLEAQSLLGYGWTDPLLESMEGGGFSLNSRIGGIVDQKNTPYMDEGSNEWHDNSCWERDTFTVTKLEYAVQPGQSVPKTCTDPNDIQRATNFIASGRNDRWKQPCHFKKLMYSKEIYTGAASKEKMFKVHSDGGNTAAMGSTDRRDPFKTYYKTDALKWGEAVPLVGYGGTKVPPLIALDKNEKIHYEFQLEGSKDLEAAEKYIENAKKDNEHMFPEAITMWISSLSRPLKFDFKENVALKGDKQTVVAQKYAPAAWTRFTKNKLPTGKTWGGMSYDERMLVSSDNFEGPEKNPTCLVNLKKDNALSIYYGSADFYGCGEGNKLTTSKNDVTVAKANVTKRKGDTVTDVKPSDEDQSRFYIEPVLGTAIKGATVTGIYALSRNGPMYTPDMKVAMVPYYATYEVSSATPEQLDQIANIFIAIPALVSLLEAILSIIGVIFCFIAFCLIFRSYRMKNGSPSEVTGKDTELSRI